MMPVMPRRRKLATDRARPLASSTRRKDPAAVPQLDLFDFNSRTEGQFDFLSHAFPCTEGATLAISSPESDEDPDFFPMLPSRPPSWKASSAAVAFGLRPFIGQPLGIT